MKPMKYVRKISCKRKNPTNKQHRKNEVTNKWQKLLSGTVITGSLLVCVLCQTERFPDTDVPKREYRLTGTSLQSIKHVTSYTGGCNTIYDDTLYEGETIVAEEGASGKQETTTLVTYLNGRAVSEDIIATRTITPATTREVRVGTKKRPEFVAPVEGYVITSYVGPRWGRSHNGLDLAVPVGTPVSNSAEVQSFNPAGTVDTASASTSTVATASSSGTVICQKYMSKSDRPCPRAKRSDYPATPVTAPVHTCTLRCGYRTKWLIRSTIWICDSHCSDAYFLAGASDTASLFWLDFRCTHARMPIFTSAAAKDPPQKISSCFVVDNPVNPANITLTTAICHTYSGILSFPSHENSLQDISGIRLCPEKMIATLTIKQIRLPRRNVMCL